MQAALQPHVDNAISKTVAVPRTSTPSGFAACSPAPGRWASRAARRSAPTRSPGRCWRAPATSTRAARRHRMRASRAARARAGPPCRLTEVKGRPGASSMMRVRPPSAAPMVAPGGHRRPIPGFARRGTRPSVLRSGPGLPQRKDSKCRFARYAIAASSVPPRHDGGRCGQADAPASHRQRGRRRPAGRRPHAAGPS